jgi:eukaryotic-like serine/threonine-protein kinase
VAQVTVVAARYVGRPVDEARAALEGLGLEVDEVTVANPQGERKGTVAGVRPTGAVDRGSTVTLSVFGAPAPEPTNSPSPSDTGSPSPSASGGSPSDDGTPASSPTDDDGGNGSGGGDDNAQDVPSLTPPAEEAGQATGSPGVADPEDEP